MRSTATAIQSTSRCVPNEITGIKVTHMIRKGQLSAIKDQASSVANQFYSLAC